MLEHAFVHSTNHKGAVAEMEIAAAAVRAGVPVLKPSEAAPERSTRMH
jgi:hypothetical protein